MVVIPAGDLKGRAKDLGSHEFGHGCFEDNNSNNERRRLSKQSLSVNVVVVFLCKFSTT